MRASRLVALAALTTLVGCAPVDPNTIEPEISALNVCHTTVVEGLDVASFQGAINWNMVHASGREFAIARIGDGTYSDPNFVTNWNGIQAAGMIRGAYLFWRPTVGAATQATAIADAVGTLGPGDLPVTIDVECMCPFMSSGACGSATAGCVSPATAAAGLTDLIDRVTTATGRPPMIYTGTWFWDGASYLHGASSHGELPLWVSGYTSGCVSVPSGWTDWHFWQYSDGSCSGCVTTPVPGISAGGGSDVDRDRWNGDLASLQAFANMGGMVTPVYGAAYVMQSFPLASAGTLQIRQGESAAAWIELRNTGTADWDANTRLATTVARDRADMFVGPDWISPNRLASVPAGMTIAPGASYRFMWTFSVPAGTPPGMYDEHFGLVEEGMVWFGDPGQRGPSDGTIEAIIEVLPGVDSGLPPPVDAGSMTGGDAGGARDAGTPASDGSMAMGDGGSVMSRGISGGCGCHAGGRSGAGGLVSIALVGLALARRRHRRADP
jgi:lysozyme